MRCFRIAYARGTGDHERASGPDLIAQRACWKLARSSQEAGKPAVLPPKRLLIVAHAPSPNTRALAAAARRGAEDPGIDGVLVSYRRAFDATVEDVLAADALVLGATENLAYMAGAVKDFFDRIYYGVIARKQGMPYALYIRAGSDGTGARLGVEKIVTGLAWRAVQAPLILKGAYDPAFEDRVEELGLALAAGLEAGVF